MSDLKNENQGFQRENADFERGLTPVRTPPLNCNADCRFCPADETLCLELADANTPAADTCQPPFSCDDCVRERCLHATEWPEDIENRIRYGCTYPSCGDCTECEGDDE